MPCGAWKCRAGAVEGYVPGTGRVGMAATAAAAAARKAAAAGESAYKAAAAAAAKSDTSESDKVGSRSKQGTAGGSDVHSSEHCEGNEGGVVSKEGAAGSSSSAHSSAEHDRLAEEGVRGTGAAVHGGAHMGKAAQGVKRVRFAEHNNFKYVYDVNAPCRRFKMDMALAPGFRGCDQGSTHTLCAMVSEGVIKEAHIPYVKWFQRV
eukprot:1157845-Pelagomonas_calceolata.AAC.14